MRIFIFNNQAQLVKEYAVARVKNEELCGGFFEGGLLYLFMENDKLKQLHTWAFNNETGTIREGSIAFNLKKQQVIACMSGGDHFVYFTAGRRKKDLTVYDFRNDKTYTQLNHAISKDVWNSIPMKMRI